MTLRDLSNTNKYPECTPGNSGDCSANCSDGQLITDVNACTCINARPIDGGTNCLTHHLITDQNTNGGCGVAACTVGQVVKGDFSGCEPGTIEGLATVNTNLNNCVNNALILDRTKTDNTACSSGTVHLKIQCKQGSATDKGLCLANYNLNTLTADCSDPAITVGDTLYLPILGATDVTTIQNRCNSLCGAIVGENGICDISLGFGSGF